MRLLCYVLALLLWLRSAFLCFGFALFLFALLLGYAMFRLCCFGFAQLFFALLLGYAFASVALLWLWLCFGFCFGFGFGFALVLLWLCFGFGFGFALAWLWLWLCFGLAGVLAVLVSCLFVVYASLGSLSIAKLPLYLFCILCSLLCAFCGPLRPAVSICAALCGPLWSICAPSVALCTPSVSICVVLCGQSVYPLWPSAALLCRLCLLCYALL